MANTALRWGRHASDAQKWRPLVAAEQQTTYGSGGDWPTYGGDAGESRYSRLSQINKSNVGRLEIALVYHMADVSDGSDGRPRSASDDPIVVDGAM